MAQQKAKERKEIKEEALRVGEKEFEQRVLDLARVTRVTKGGKRMRFRALVLVGNKAGKVGFGLEKAASVAAAVQKAVRQARKHLLTIPLKGETIEHQVYAKFGAAKVLLKPAPQGTGIKAGGAARAVLELGGVPNIVGKSLGGKNKINNVKATLEALKRLKSTTA